MGSLGAMADRAVKRSLLPRATSKSRTSWCPRGSKAGSRTAARLSQQRPPAARRSARRHGLLRRGGSRRIFARRRRFVRISSRRGSERESRPRRDRHEGSARTTASSEADRARRPIAPHLRDLLGRLEAPTYVGTSTPLLPPRAANLRHSRPPRAARCAFGATARGWHASRPARSRLGSDVYGYVYAAPPSAGRETCGTLGRLARPDVLSGRPREAGIFATCSVGLAPTYMGTSTPLLPSRAANLRHSRPPRDGPMGLRSAARGHRIFATCWVGFGSERIWRTSTPAPSFAGRRICGALGRLARPDGAAWVRRRRAIGYSRVAIPQLQVASAVFDRIPKLVAGVVTCSLGWIHRCSRPCDERVDSTMSHGTDALHRRPILILDFGCAVHPADRAAHPRAARLLRDPPGAICRWSRSIRAFERCAASSFRADPRACSTRIRPTCDAGSAWSCGVPDPGDLLRPAADGQDGSEVMIEPADGSGVRPRAPARSRSADTLLARSATRVGDRVVWMSHGDRLLAPSARASRSLREQRQLPIRGGAATPTDAHLGACSSTPRSSHTDGRRRDPAQRFVHDVCGCDAHDYTTERRSSRRAMRGDPRAGRRSTRLVCGLSGGVDSSVAAALVHRADGRPADVHLRRSRS